MYPIPLAGYTQRNQGVSEHHTSTTTTTTNNTRTVTPYRPKTLCTLSLHIAFIITNMAIVVLLFLAWVWFNHFVRVNTASSIYGPSTGLPCSSRMLIWTEALFGLSIATKFALFWILLTEFLSLHVIQQSNKGLECMIFTSLVFKIAIPFGFSFKLFWHLCGSVVLADARACHLAWVESPLPGNAYYAEDLMKLKEADGQLLNQLQLLWLAILFIYLVATTLFLLCLIFCTPSTSSGIQHIGTDHLERTATRPEGLPTPNEGTQASQQTSGRIYSTGEAWQWLTDTEPIARRPSRPRRPRRMLLQDFEELPQFCFKQVLEQHRGTNEGQQRKSKPILGNWFHRKQKSPMEASTETAPAGERVTTTFPGGSSSMTSVASAPDFRITTTEDCVELADVEETELANAERTPGEPRSSLEDDIRAYVTELPRCQPPVIAIDPQHQMNQSSSDSNGSSDDHSAISIQSSTPLDQEILVSENQDISTTIIELGPTSDNNENTEWRQTQSNDAPSYLLRTRSITAGRPSQALLWERRRTWNGFRPTSRNITYLYHQPCSGDRTHYRPVTGNLPQVSLVDSQQLQRYSLIDGHLNLYNFFLLIIYALITLTDIRSPPDCCSRTPDAEIDDYINTAVSNVILCCGPNPSLFSGFQLCIKKAWTRFRNCVLCREPDGSIKRHLSKKDKETLVHEAFEKTSEQLTVCCICFNDFQSSDVLVVVPCSYRHYFHQTCARLWLRRNSSCPLCRADLAEGLDNLRRNGTAVKPPISDASQEHRSMTNLLNQISDEPDQHSTEQHEVTESSVSLNV